MKIKYEIIGRSIVTTKSGPDQHALKLLYRGDETPWWNCSASLELPVSADFKAQPGEFLEISLKVVSK